MMNNEVKKGQPKADSPLAKKKIVIASGKGGVGKSMLASALAMLFAKDNKVSAADCDVDAPNLAIWLNEAEEWDESRDISTVSKPIIDKAKCIGCGACEENCQFKAINLEDGKAKLNYFLCEGCGVCELVCPVGAAKLKPVKNARMNIKKTKYGFPLVSAELRPGESSSGKVVSEVKEEAEKYPHDLMIIDSSPGTGCPVIASLEGASLAVLITEPTPSGLSDLCRVLETVKHFGIPYQIVTNKWDLNKEMTNKIKKKFQGKILGEISYDKEIVKAISRLEPILETQLKAKSEITSLFEKLKKII